MPSLPFHALVASAASLAALASVSPARADSPPLSLDRFRPSAAGDRLFGVESPQVEAGRLDLSLLASYAHDPLVVTRGTSHDEVVDRAVREQLLFHVGLGVDIASRLKLDLDLPFTVAQSGEGATVQGHSFAAPEGGQFGDTRLGGRVVLLRQDGAIPGASISFRAYFASGAADQYSGAGSTRYAPSLVVGATYSSWLWSAQLGRTFLPSAATVPGITGSDVFLSAGIAAKVDDLWVGPEVYATTVADGISSSFSRTTSSVEALLGAKWYHDELSIGLGAGPGFAAGIGTPTYRAVLGIAYTPKVERTRGGSQVNTAGSSAHGDDGATSVALGTNGPVGIVGVPLDTDDDGVPDTNDECPRAPGIAGGKHPGCPSDRDEDGTVDAADACPDEAGVRSNDPAKNGCPADTDGDGIPDAKDACPNDKGPTTNDPKDNGCPRSVRIEGPQIVITRILFENAAAVLKPESAPVLEQVAALMNAHPEIARVAVDGHTDDRGLPARNMALSEARAMAVVRWLVDHGVDSRRLEARAFGPRQPIAPNTTEEGRAKNRRVEFQIRKRTADGERGWTDGPVTP